MGRNAAMRLIHKHMWKNIQAVGNRISKMDMESIIGMRIKHSLRFSRMFIKGIGRWGKGKGLGCFCMLAVADSRDILWMITKMGLVLSLMSVGLPK